MGFLVRLIGIEPTHPAPEAGALSTELRAHKIFITMLIHFTANHSISQTKN